MFDLNDIWRVFRLEEKNRPSEWRGKARQDFVRSADLRSENGGSGKNRGATYATIEALYTYSMWVDVEFHDVVCEAFEKLTEDKTLTTSKNLV